MGSALSGLKLIAISHRHILNHQAKEYDLDGVKAMLDETPELVNVQPAGRWPLVRMKTELDMACVASSTCEISEKKTRNMTFAHRNEGSSGGSW